MDSKLEAASAASHAAYNAERRYHTLGAQMSHLEETYRKMSLELASDTLTEERRAELETSLPEIHKDVLDVRSEWCAARMYSEELHNTYNELLKELKAFYKEDYYHYVCSFCGQMSMDCGDDHGDEMRDIIRESGGW